MSQEELNEELIKASRRGDIDKVRTLLPKLSTCGFTQGADVRAGDDSALRWAANNGHTEIVQVLLQAGADVHAMDDEALRYAARRGHTETVLVLLQAGANVHAHNDKSLRWAAYFGNIETVQALLQVGADVHAMDDLALLCAAENGHAKNGHTATKQVLLQAGANSTHLAFPALRKLLTPKFILSLSDSVITAMETSHPELKEQYRYSEKKSRLKSTKSENTFHAKISLADLYYRPGGPAYYQAVSLD